MLHSPSQYSEAAYQVGPNKRQAIFTSHHCHAGGCAIVYLTREKKLALFSHSISIVLLRGGVVTKAFASQSIDSNF